VPVGFGMAGSRARSAAPPGASSWSGGIYASIPGIANVQQDYHLPEVDVGSVLRFKFSAEVLNGIASASWCAQALLPPEAVLPTAGLLFMKLRIPESVCKRDTFVRWAGQVLPRYPEGVHGHTPWHAVASLQALLYLRTEMAADFDVLSDLQVFALAAAALASNVASIGLTDEELVDMAHPILLALQTAGRGAPVQAPNAQGALSEVMKASASAQSNIFGQLSAGSRQRVVEDIFAALCCASSVHTVSRLEKELVVAKNIAQVKQVADVDLAAGKPRGAVSPGVPETRLSPDLALRLAAALCHLSSAWKHSDDFRLLEEMEALRALVAVHTVQGNRVSDAGEEALEVGRAKRRQAWQGLRPLLAAAEEITVTEGPFQLMRENLSVLFR